MVEKIVGLITDGLAGKIGYVDVKGPRRVYIDVASEDLQDVARYIFTDLKARYAIASGIDAEDHFEVLHHFAFDADHVVVTLRVKADAENPEVPSLAPFIKAASFIEREMHDLLGIDFPGHPNLARLILPDEWPEGVYPLRRGKHTLKQAEANA